MSEPNQPKQNVRDAQRKHMAALFGDDAKVQAPGAQQADDQAAYRARKLQQAAEAKERQLDDDEQARLAALRARNTQAKQDSASVPEPPVPAADADVAASAPAPAPKPHRLKELSHRNDLASAALRNMQRHVRDERQTNTQSPTDADAPQPPRRAPAATDTSANTPSAPAPTPPPPPARSAPPRPKRAAPSPEELDRLLRAMAQRAAKAQGDRPRGTAPPRPPMRPGQLGGERMEADPYVEAPPPPPDVPEDNPEQKEKRQAEILQELRAIESKQQSKAQLPQPQHDQDRAVEAAVEAEIPIETEGNAVRSAPLHQAIAQLQQAMKAHDPDDQVIGVNQVHQNMPNHPLWNDGSKDE